jgi:hypothetical protein
MRATRFSVSLLAAVLATLCFSTAAFALVATTTTVVATPTSSTFAQSVSFDATVAGQTGSPRNGVQLKEGATILATQNVNGQLHAIITLSTLSVGSHTLTATYVGNASSASSSSAPFTFVVSKANTTTSMTAPTAITYGASASFTATVSGPGTLPTGSIAFNEGLTTLCTGTLASVGGVATASCNAAGLTAGSHSVVASYSGDASYNTSSASAATQTVNKANTSATVLGSPSPSSATELVTFTANVNSAAAGTIGGSVDFYDGATKLNAVSVPLAAGSAAYSTAALSVGGHSITAHYLGDSNYNLSTSSAATQNVNLAVTTTSLTALPNPAIVTQAVTLTATIASGISGTITGTVDFYDGATKLNDTPVAITAGSAAFQPASLALGNHSFTAQYSGDAVYAGSTSTAVSHDVNHAVTTTTLNATPNPSSFGVNVTFTATVGSNFAGTISGTVDFYDGATKLNDTPVALTAGAASFQTAALAIASHSMTAQYSGDSTYATSTSDAVSLNVAPAVTTTTLSALPAATTLGDSVTLTAMVASNIAGTIGGSVDFYDGATKLNDTPVALNSGQAGYATSALTVGVHSLTAQFSGDTTYAASVSSAQTVNVRTASTTTLLSSANPAKVGTSITFTATVSPNTATGTVDLVEGATTIASGAISGGVATINVSVLTVGSHSIVARYSGDSTYGPSDSSPVAQAITGAPRSDLNNDGHSDIVLQNTITSAIAAWLMNSNSILEGKVVASPIAAWHIVATGDFDGDGKADLLLQNSTSGAIAQWKMNGTVLAAGAIVTTSSLQTRIVATRDFDGDGKADIVVQNSTTGEVRVWLMNGPIIVNDVQLGIANTNFRAVALGRLGGNAVVFQNQLTGEVTRWIVSGTSVTSDTTVGVPIPSTAKVVAVGDFNSDGNDDVAFQNPATRTVSAWLVNASGDGILSVGTVATPVAGWTVVGGGDYDGDGYGDLLLYNSITNGIAEWQLNGTVIARGWNVGTLAGWKPLGN